MKKLLTILGSVGLVA
ncbi:lipoprotein, partial [Mycoplasma mycoides]